jgi:hypothetical protein
LIDENTKPSARVGRKTYRVSMRQPGCRNIIRYCGIRLFYFWGTRKEGAELTDGSFSHSTR